MAQALRREEDDPKTKTPANDRDGAFIVDLFFGFLGASLGTDAVTDGWKAADTASAYYEDRSKPAQHGTRANGRTGDFKLGVKHSLGPFFSSPAAGVVMEDPRNVLAFPARTLSPWEMAPRRKGRVLGL